MKGKMLFQSFESWGFLGQAFDVWENQVLEALELDAPDRNPKI
jgi:hypothetical protein